MALTRSRIDVILWLLQYNPAPARGNKKGRLKVKKLNCDKFTDLNYGENRRIYKSELDHIQYAGEKAESESIQDLYGEKAEAATAIGEGRNDELFARIAALNEWNRNIERDLLSKDDKVRQRARIRAAAMTDAVDVINVGGVWKVTPRKGGSE